MRHLTAVLVGAVLLPIGLTGCGDTEDSEGAASRTLTVFAAASLTESFTALGRTFERTHPGVDVRFSFGGSSTLAQQIAQGAPADVFAAASPATMKPVADDGLTSGAPRTFARNRLVIAVPPGDRGRVRTLRDLARGGLKVVLCAPQVPCGAAARTALAAAGVEVTPVSQEQDVKAVLTKVRMGEADAGLVYRTDVRAAGADVAGVEFPESARAINDYPIAVLAEGRQPGLARRFADLVLSARGRATLAGAGFEVP
ncbi:molybdate ABC transporter substrate-binding protein [Thermomonospora umbrina]|uniref:molybdate ABC transporter substrate-binding protein n=1 Tax=Thermomonospora umbrina TaxID=111806 RepID=UPI001B860969